MEAEHYADLLGVIRTLCREIVRKHGGSVARLQGDGILVVFGFPESREDDGRRAVDAALELHEAVSRIALSGHAASTRVLALHSGIHSGLTLVRDGGVEVGSVDVLGDVPNIAANLSSVAQRGEIIVSAETLGPQAHFFQTEPRKIAVKGRAGPLHAYRVFGQRHLKRRYDAHAVRGLAPFVGREAELQMLVGCLQARTETPRCVAVVGGPGLGKTRLVEEVLHAARGASSIVLNGYCESYLTAEPLQPFLQILRAVLGIKPELSANEATAAAEAALERYKHLGADVRADLLRTLAPSSSDSERRASSGATVAAFAALLESLASRAKVVLILDDWQWADELSQRVLDGLLNARGSVFILIASRADTDGVLPPVASIIELAPLELEQTRQALTHLLPQADPFITAEIHRYAGGVPLFIEELCHSVASEGLDKPVMNKLGAAWLSALIESRVERLPADQRAVTAAAAVIGNVFPSWLLERLTGHGADSPVVRALANLDFIFPSSQPGMMRFKHGLTRDVIYHVVGLKERKALHLAAAEAIASRDIDNSHDEAIEALAYHFAAADVPAKAVHFAELAGDKALGAFALDRARAQYTATLRAMEARGIVSREQKLAWCRLAEKLGMACVWDPLALSEGVEIFERSVALAHEADDLHALSRAEYWLSYICYSKGNARAALVHGQESLRLAGQIGDDRLADQIRATLGQALASACQYERALPLLGGAVESKRARGRPGSSLAVGSAYALACKGSILGDRGQFALAEEAFEEALALVGGTDHQVGSSVRNWISAVYQWQGRWQDGERVAEASMRVAELCKSRQLLAMSRALWGHANWMLHGNVEAIGTIKDATAWIEARKGALVTSLNYGWLVAATQASGRHEESRRHAARLFVRARQHDRLGEAMGCRALAQSAAARREFALAHRYLARAERAALARESAHERASNQLVAAEVALAEERRSDARKLLDAAQTAFESMAMPWHLKRASALRERA